MKTIWTNELTGTHYSDYDEAANNVLEHARYIEWDIIREVLEEHTPYEILQEAENRFLSEFLVEVEDDEEDEEDEEI